MGAATEQRKIRVAIIGAGISGIGQAIRLRERLGTKVEITIYDRHDDVGGVWTTSRWPGAGVDVPIHWYQLYSDPKHDWPTVYAKRADVYDYWNSLINKHSLRHSIELSTTFLGSRWSDATHSHTMTLQRASGKPFEVEVDFLISATGPLSTASYPAIPGIEQFEGIAFHCYNWDTSVQLEGKRVGVIGNGSSGVQMVPGLSEISGVKVTQFIRSGGYFRPKVDREYSSLTKLAFKYIPGVGYLYRLFLIYSWANKPLTSTPEDLATRRKAEDSANEYLRKKAPAQYLEALTPDYPLGCKRIAMDAGWLASLHKPNVHLTNSPITSANKTGLTTADGIHHNVDLVIFATGASVATLGLGLNKSVFDRHGRELRQRWKELGGPEAYRGVAVPELPNYFITMGPNGTAGPWGFSLGVNTAAIARIIGEVVENGGTAVEVKEEAAREYNRVGQAFLQTTPLASAECTSWFKVKPGGKVTLASGYTPHAWWWLTRTTRWNDWVVRRKGIDGRDEEVNVGLRILLKQAVRGAVWLAVAGVAVSSLVYDRQTGGFARELEWWQGRVGL